MDVGNPENTGFLCQHLYEPTTDKSVRMYQSGGLCSGQDEEDSLGKRWWGGGTGTGTLTVTSTSLLAAHHPAYRTPPATNTHLLSGDPHTDGSPGSSCLLTPPMSEPVFLTRISLILLPPPPVL